MTEGKGLVFCYFFQLLQYFCSYLGTQVRTSCIVAHTYVQRLKCCNKPSHVTIFNFKFSHVKREKKRNILMKHRLNCERAIGAQTLQENLGILSLHTDAVVITKVWNMEQLTGRSLRIFHSHLYITFCNLQVAIWN